MVISFIYTYLASFLVTFAEFVVSPLSTATIYYPEVPEELKKSS
ncbi:cyclic lactone autoinducer peptide [Ammoniphilus sp. CFH 90114]|nr:cyclic lactone autoinducer peptide [Ammoniphilus sp. CFH 90114]RXT04562.1 cyclic lactone autoinducer peptide [Ammoniphilus sp. CFH 90114]